MASKDHQSKRRSNGGKSSLMSLEALRELKKRLSGPDSAALLFDECDVRSTIDLHVPVLWPVLEQELSLPEVPPVALEAAREIRALYDDFASVASTDLKSREKLGEVFYLLVAASNGGSWFQSPHVRRLLGSMMRAVLKQFQAIDSGSYDLPLLRSRLVDLGAGSRLSARAIMSVYAFERCDSSREAYFDARATLVTQAAQRHKKHDPQRSKNTPPRG
jgi:hypothetical protein